MKTVTLMKREFEVEYFFGPRVKVKLADHESSALLSAGALRDLAVELDKLPQEVDQ